MTSYKNRSLHLSTEASYAVAPRPADNTFQALRATGIEANGGPETLESELIIGRTGRSEIAAGGTSASGNFTMRMLGLATQGGDGDSPDTEDYLDLVLGGIANSVPVERVGENATGLTGTALTLDTDVLSVGDLVPLEDASGNVAWAAVAADDTLGGYTLDFEPRIGSSAVVPALTRPFRQWVDDGANDNLRSYYGVYKLGTLYRGIPGLKLNSLSAEWTPRQFVNFAFGFAGADFSNIAAPTFDTATNGDPASLGSAPRTTGCFYVDGVKYSTPSISIDFGLDVQEVPDTCEESGRSDMVLNDALPTITVTTPIAQVWRDLHENKGVRDLKIVSGHAGPSVCIHFPAAQVSEVSPQETNGRITQSVTFMAIARGDEPLFRIARS